MLEGMGSYPCDRNDKLRLSWSLAKPTFLNVPGVAVAVVVHQRVGLVERYTSGQVDGVQGVGVGPFDPHAPEDVIRWEIRQWKFFLQDLGQIRQEIFRLHLLIFLFKKC